MSSRPAWVEGTSSPDYVLHRICYRRTFWSSIVGGAFVFSGLLVLGIGERGLAGHGRQVLIFRVLAWFIFAVVPFQALTCMNFRCLAMYGLQPSWNAPVSLNPVMLKNYAHQRGLPKWRAVVMPYMFYLFAFMVFAMLLALPLGSPRDHFGLVFVVGVGQFVVTFAGDEFMSRWLPMLEPTWAMMSGPYSCGVVFFGYICLITLYVLVRSAVATRWLGIGMALLVSAFELLSVEAIGYAFRRFFIMSLEARVAYHGTQQSIYICIIVGVIHSLAESARLVLVIYEAQTSGDFGAVSVSICSSLVCNIAVRSGWMQRCLTCLSLGYYYQRNLGLLLQAMKFPVGYVRFMAVMAILATRKALGHSALPGGAVGMATLTCLAAELIEDVLLSLFACLGLHAVPVFPTLTWEQALERAKDGTTCSSRWLLLLGRASRALNSDVFRAGPAAIVVPGSGSPSGSTDVERLRAGLLLEAHQFSTTVLLGESSPVLPRWAHFAVVYSGMFTLVLSAIFVLGGIDFVLGFSDNIAAGTSARAVLWWPLRDPT